MIKRLIYFSAIVFTCNLSFGQLANSNNAGNSNKISIGLRDTINSAILKEQRIINISLPEDYSPDSAKNYPVIYLLDGGVTEDFIHVTGLVRFFTTPWINQFPGSIVVGIENVNRTRDFTFSTDNLDFVSKIGLDKNIFQSHGQSANFISFIEKELQPFIEKHYKANTDKTLIGESLGGLLATEILLNHTHLFNTYIIVSPSLWWGNESLLTGNPKIASGSFKNLKIYIGAAKKSEDTIMFNDAENLYLRLKKYQENNSIIKFDYLPDETHATILHHAIYNAFKVLYRKTK